MTLAIGIVVGSVREKRFGDRIGHWFLGLARQRPELAPELFDLRELALPEYRSALPPRMIEDRYDDPRAKSWVETVRRLDGFVVVTPEYNHGYPAALKNALDLTYSGWNHKPMAFVSYGGPSGGVRAVEQLRLVAVELQAAPIRAEVNVPFVFRALGDDGAPLDPFHAERAGVLLDQLAWWATVLKEGRANHPVPPPAPPPKRA